MENYNEKKREVKNDLIDVDTEKDTPRNEENIEKNSSSNVTSKFEKSTAVPIRLLAMDMNPVPLLEAVFNQNI